MCISEPSGSTRSTKRAKIAPWLVLAGARIARELARRVDQAVLVGEGKPHEADARCGRAPEPCVDPRLVDVVLGSGRTGAGVRTASRGRRLHLAKRATARGAACGRERRRGGRHRACCPAGGSGLRAHALAPGSPSRSGCPSRAARLRLVAGSSSGCEPSLATHGVAWSASRYCGYVCTCGSWASSATVASAQLQVQ